MRAQNSDRFTLEETLAIMRGLPGYYRDVQAKAYEDGFTGRWDPGDIPRDLHDGRFQVYSRSYRHGREAWERGAHKESA